MDSCDMKKIGGLSLFPPNFRRLIQRVEFLRTVKSPHPKKPDVIGNSSKVTQYVKYLGKFFGVLYGAGILFALNVPDDILTQYPFLQGFTSVMMQIFPAINAVEKRSAFPEISTLYLSVSWFFSPLYLLYSSGFFYTISRTRSALENRCKLPTLRAFISSFLCLLFFPLVLFLSFHHITGQTSTSCHLTVIGGLLDY
jgi:hypothetical protein